MVHCGTRPTQSIGNDWLALLLEPPDVRARAGHPGVGRGLPQHGEFGAPQAITSSAARRCIHRPPRRRCGCATARRSLTDGPYVEGAEVANGFYLLRRRGSRRGRQARVDDPRVDGGGTSAGRRLGAVAAE